MTNQSVLFDVQTQYFCKRNCSSCRIKSRQCIMIFWEVKLTLLNQTGGNNMNLNPKFKLHMGSTYISNSFSFGILYNFETYY